MSLTPPMPSLPRLPPLRAAAIVALAVALRPCPDLGAAAGPRVVVQGPDRVVSGAGFESLLGIDPLGSRVLSWAICASLDGSRAVDVTAAATDFEELAPDGFAEIRLAEDGSAFGSVGVLSFSGSSVLPDGTSTLLRCVQEVTRKEPGEGRMLPADGFPWPEGEPLSNQVLLEGGGTLALAFEEAVFAVAGCAEVDLEAEDATTEGGAPVVEIPRGSTVTIRVVVRVPSAEHHHPAGLRLGVSHDPSVLALESVELGPAVTDDFLRPDGLARIDRDDGGFAVTVLSSETEPSRWGEGAHSVAAASYRFLGTAGPGESYAARFGWIDGGEIGGAEVRAELLPEGARPCRLEEWILTVRVAPDEWIRGDSNGDGHVDISDGITTLGHLFLGKPADCEAGMEVDSNDRVDLTDAVYLLNHLFLSGPAPSAPFPDCGWAPSTLGCATSACRP